LVCRFQGFASLTPEAGTEANDYYRKYQNRIQSVKDLGFEIDYESGSWRFGDNGWV